MAIRRGEESFSFSDSKILQFTKAQNKSRTKGLVVLPCIKINSKTNYVLFCKKDIFQCVRGCCPKLSSGRNFKHKGRNSIFKSVKSIFSLLLTCKGHEGLFKISDSKTRLTHR